MSTTAPLLNWSDSLFVAGAHNNKQLPVDDGIEIAVAGRSNAGKSSVINALLERRRLAVVSATPGRTRQCNCFLIGQRLRLLDWPGYGYAAVSQRQRKQWQHNFEHYLMARRSLLGLILVVDIRRRPEAEEETLAAACNKRLLPLLLLLNKCDKIPQSETLRCTRRWETLSATAHLPIAAARQRKGIDTLRQQLTSWLPTPPIS